MKLLRGKEISQEIRKEIRKEITAMRDRISHPPGLAVLLVGEDPASLVYVRNKKLACEEVGVASFPYFLSKDISDEALLQLISSLNEDERVHGILVQLPLPEQIRSSEAAAEPLSPMVA